MELPKNTTIKLKIERDYFVFSAAHFAVLSGEVTEPLHGHNYQISLAVEGEVNDEGYIVQFADLKSVVRGVIDRLNHKTIIPNLCKILNIKHISNSINIETKSGKLYVLPAADVALLPINNTTVEALSSYIAKEIMSALPPKITNELIALHVSVEESIGQGATTSIEF